MFRLKLGVSLGTVVESIDATSLEVFADSSVATVEVGTAVFSQGNMAAETAVLADTLRRHTIQPATIHAAFGNTVDISSLDEDTRTAGVQSVAAAIELADAVDAAMIVVHASGEPVDPHERTGRLGQVGRSLIEIGARARQAGRRVAIELLPRTCLGNTVEELFGILDPRDGETFGICLDTNHLMDRCGDLADDVRKLAPRLVTLHLSDYDGVDEKHWLPGKGVVDWRAFMQALRDIDYQGPFNYECSLQDSGPAMDRLRALEENFQWLSGL